MTNKEQLYQEFLKVFPLESLKDMSLEQYTNLERDNSFCYWLEFRLKELGGIQGGSASKFGIYACKSSSMDERKMQTDGKYAWYKKYGVESSSEAFAIVKEAVCEIAQSASEGNLDEIEANAVLGEVVKWKIAFLYSNKQLVYYYKKDMLRKIAEHYDMPDSENATIAAMQRYLRDIRGEQDIFTFVESISSIVSPDKEKEKNISPKVWLFAPGENASQWDYCLQEGSMCIGWDKMGNLEDYETKMEVKEGLQQAYDNPDSTFTNDTLALWQFAHIVKPGDIVFAKKGIHSIIGKGVVEGAYNYDETRNTYRNIRRVKWDKTGEWDLTDGKLPMKTLTDISDDDDFVKKLDALVDGKESEPDTAAKNHWWLVANPKIWSMQSLAVGDTIEYTLYSDTGRKRRIFQNFLDAKKEDIVVCYESTPTLQVVALAKVAQESDGDAIIFQKTEEIPNPIDLSQIKELPELEEMQFLKNPQGTFYKLTADEYDALEDLIRNVSPIAERKTVESYTKEDFLHEVFMDGQDYDVLESLIFEKKNVILQGAPGVGKTFSAKRMAYSLMGVKDDSRIELIQFHQNYSYEDFVIGYRPNESGGFKAVRGVFNAFCRKAANDLERPYFFIIDEINRGNLSKIFGELLMLIEKNYRDYVINLPYNEEKFFVPKNVYIIGMMNTADRSLAMIDYALRRRFSFYDMKPAFDSDGFRQYQQSLDNPMFDKVISSIKELNHAIEQDDSLGSGFCIGHSYFSNMEKDKVTNILLTNVIKYDILPMLKEYWFDDRTKYKAEAEKLLAALK